MQPIDYKKLLMYWIQERMSILDKKRAGQPPPWSEDVVFTHTYFCNVRREDDKVTRFIRDMYSPHVTDKMLEYNLILSRFLNWPPSLTRIGYQYTHDPDGLEKDLDYMANAGIKVWGGAYVITTHGMKMSKAHYLAQHVLQGAYSSLDAILKATRPVGSPPFLQAAHGQLMQLEGLGSFLAAQIVADLKNTKDHPLHEAEDWWTFVAPGPGSLRGVSWFLHSLPDTITMNKFPVAFPAIREYVDANWPTGVPRICNQDLQNCLCEFDKYCRVLNGTGRSKRHYNP